MHISCIFIITRVIRAICSKNTISKIRAVHYLH